MTRIQLSATKRCRNRGRYAAVVDDADADLAAYAWHAKVCRGGANHLVYAVAEVLGADGVMRRMRMHRVIWERANGPIPGGFEIDHIDHGDDGGLDNRRLNLRLVPHALNTANARLKVNNASGFKGVHFVRRTGRWQALIRVNGRRRHLGYFDRPEQGGAAYDVAARHAWGDSARTNASIRTDSVDA